MTNRPVDVANGNVNVVVGDIIDIDIAGNGYGRILGCGQVARHALFDQDVVAMEWNRRAIHTNTLSVWFSSSIFSSDDERTQEKMKNWCSRCYQLFIALKMSCASEGMHARPRRWFDSNEIGSRQYKQNQLAQTWWPKARDNKHYAKNYLLSFDGDFELNKI